MEILFIILKTFNRIFVLSSKSLYLIYSLIVLKYLYYRSLIELMKDRISYYSNNIKTSVTTSGNVFFCYLLTIFSLFCYYFYYILLFAPIFLLFSTISTIWNSRKIVKLRLSWWIILALRLSLRSLRWRNKTMFSLFIYLLQYFCKGNLYYQTIFSLDRTYIHAKYKGPRRLPVNCPICCTSWGASIWRYRRWNQVQ